MEKTQDQEYSYRLVSIQTVWWKRYIDVQAPYRWILQRQNPGFTLEIGCGVGRNLKNLKGNAVGIDHNPKAIELVRSFGYQAYLPDDFLRSEYNRPDCFDTILFSHVAEHMTRAQVVELINQYTAVLKVGGKLILVTPQEVGYRSDKTHIEFMDFKALRSIVNNIGFVEIKSFSYPFPRIFGHLFIYNEFISVSKKPGHCHLQTELLKRAALP